MIVRADAFRNGSGVLVHNLNQKNDLIPKGLDAQYPFPAW
jgi:hypothetical protein